MTSFTQEIEAQNARIKEAEQRYQTSKRDHDPIKMKEAIDDIADIQKTIQRLQQDEASRLIDEVKDKALIEYRERRDAAHSGIDEIEG